MAPPADALHHEPPTMAAIAAANTEVHAKRSA